MKPIYERTKDEVRESFHCIDCGFDTLEGGEYYMVHNYLWEQAGMTSEGGMLCIGCLEDRLGFVLTPHHFTDYPINSLDNGWDKSWRLTERLTTWPEDGSGSA